MIFFCCCCCCVFLHLPPAKNLRESSHHTLPGFAFYNCSTSFYIFFCVYISVRTTCIFINIYCLLRRKAFLNLLAYLPHVLCCTWSHKTVSFSVQTMQTSSDTKFPLPPLYVFRYLLGAQNDLQLHRRIPRRSLNIFLGSLAHLPSPSSTLELDYHELWRAGELRAPSPLTAAGFESCKAASQGARATSSPLLSLRGSTVPSLERQRQRGMSRERVH